MDPVFRCPKVLAAIYIARLQSHILAFVYCIVLLYLAGWFVLMTCRL